MDGSSWSFGRSSFRAAIFRSKPLASDFKRLRDDRDSVFVGSGDLCDDRRDLDGEVERVRERGEQEFIEPLRREMEDDLVL
mmetsp:Transcript_26960/g.63058  ORF Transcript_26960/g.63058 Transcript_26960/m.63058 type:complete len:81 (+) Transcript_26960:1545-1787(+)